MYELLDVLEASGTTGLAEYVVPHLTWEEVQALTGPDIVGLPLGYKPPPAAKVAAPALPAGTVAANSLADAAPALSAPAAVQPALAAGARGGMSPAAASGHPAAVTAAAPATPGDTQATPMAAPTVGAVPVGATSMAAGLRKDAAALPTAPANPLPAPAPLATWAEQTDAAAEASAGATAAAVAKSLDNESGMLLAQGPVRVAIDALALTTANAPSDMAVVEQSRRGGAVVAAVGWRQRGWRRSQYLLHTA